MMITQNDHVQNHEVDHVQDQEIEEERDDLNQSQEVVQDRDHDHVEEEVDDIQINDLSHDHRQEHLQIILMQKKKKLMLKMNKMLNRHRIRLFILMKIKKN